MSESADEQQVQHEPQHRSQQGVGKTGGLPGSNADPLAAETPERELQELQAAEVSPPETGSAGR